MAWLTSLVNAPTLKNLFATIKFDRILLYKSDQKDG